MITMIDEIFDRQYQAGRHQLNAGIDAGLRRLGHEVGIALKALNRIQFAAPWANKTKRVRSQ
jgi:hypothetical protein